MRTRTSTIVAWVIVALLISPAVVMAQEDETLVIDDFEVDELFVGLDQHNNDIGHAAWGDTAGNVTLSIAEMQREGDSSSVLEVAYDIGSWGGFTHAFNDGENWVGQDWTGYGALQFWLYGNNSGGTVQVEIFDNRNPGLVVDTAERWYFRITDNYEGWQQFTIPFDSFQRRTDWQPGGAPDDGLGLNEVSGYAFSFPSGVGTQVAYIDNVELVSLEVEPLIVDDFEIDELFSGQDESSNSIGFIPWGDTDGNVALRLTDAQRSGETTRALTVDYDITASGGFSHVFNDGEDWTTQDWTSFNVISFWFLGGNTSGTVQFEILDNRNPDLDGDSAERWSYQFVDDSYGWKLIEIPFEAFKRRIDWQPDGAPDDGLNLNAVSGYAFGFPAGTGKKFAFIDSIRLIVIPGVSMPAPAVSDDVASPPTAQLEEIVLNEALLEAIPYVEPMLVSGFESGVPYVTDANGVAIGFVTWGDRVGNALIGTTQILPYTDLGLPIWTEPNQVIRIDYEIAAWGGFNYAFTDGESWVSQDWTNHNALQFWLYGNNTGQPIEINILDNRVPDSEGDTAERFFYILLDDFEGWQQFTIPFAFFQRRTDWQPGGALDDGFNLDAVSGYSFGFPAGVGQKTAYMDEVQVVVVEDPTQVQIATSEEEEVIIEIDETIGWDTREWELIWSDEFDADKGTPINDEFWTCEIGGHGWGNSELEYYTDHVENVAHDGNGNLIITAIEESLEGSTCHYGQCAYTSARCITQDKVEFTYGRVEARIDIPNGQGIWPAFWMLGADFPAVGWPNSGEIDILENVGEPNVVYSTLHGPGYSGGANLGGVFRSEENLDDDFHVYAIDWDENVIRWYVDGELVNLISANALTGQQWVFNHDFFILMNIAVGGDWPGNPDDTTEFPQTMLVDYVRVYKLSEAD